MDIVGNNIYLRILSSGDVGDKYVEWMRDEETVRFLESRWKTYTLENLKEYVNEINESRTDFLFGIFLRENDEHIGNIKVRDVDYVHKHGDVGIMIGDKNSRGKGCGRESIQLVTKYAFEELNLNSLIAGIYANNIGCYKAFLSAGYNEAGSLKKHLFYNGKFVDKILVEKNRS